MAKSSKRGRMAEEYKGQVLAMPLTKQILLLHTIIRNKECTSEDFVFHVDRQVTVSAWCY